MKAYSRPPNSGSATAFLGRLFGPPVFESDEKTHRAYIVHSVVWTTLFFVAVFIIVGILQQPAIFLRPLTSLSVVALLGVITLAVNRCGRTDLASWLFILGLVTLVTVMSLPTGGIRSIGVTSYLVAVMMACVLVGERAGILMTLLCGALGFGLVLAERFEVLPPQAVPFNGFNLWLRSCMYMAITLVFMRLAARTIAIALQRASRELEIRKQTEQRLELALDAGSIGVWELDLSTNEFRGDDHAFAMLGIPVPLGHLAPFESWKSIVHPVDLPGVLASIQSLRGDVMRMRSAHRIIRPNGELRYLEAAGLAVLNAHGHPIRVVGMMTDVTARRTAEEEREQLESQLQSAMEDAVIGMTFVTPDGRWIEANPAFCKLVGYPRSEIVGIPFQTITHPDDVVEDTAALERMVSGETNIRQAEKRYIHKEGHSVWVQLSMNLVRNPDGSPRHFVSQVQDITERKEAEISLQRSEDMFSKVFRLSPDAMSITDMETGTYLYVNDAFERIFGLSAEEVEGQTPWELGILPDPGAIEAMVNALKKTSHLQEMEVEARNSKGERLVMLSSAEQVELAGHTCILRVSRDITKQKQLEEQFRQSQKMEAIGQLAGGVAHDFNNILAVIQLQVDMLTAVTNPTDTQLEFIEVIGAASQRAASLTRQLLMFSRQQAMRQRNLDLNKSIADVTKLLHRTIGEVLRVQFKFSDELLMIQADPGMIDQLLMNLTVNARDAMPNGGDLLIETTSVEFDERTAAESANIQCGSYACLSVSDTGCGIAPEHLNRIFEPFFTTKEVGKGTGLGLATVFGVVQQHKGWINVYSEVGLGTTFRIYFPRLIHPSPQEAKQSVEIALPGHEETILLVEDDSFLRASVSKTLSQLGYRVLEAINGVAALEVWKQHHTEIRLLLTDMVMPGGITGLELGELLLAENPNLKVIYASGYSAEVANREFPLQEGVNFLTKPYEANKLATTIRACLS